MKIIQSNDKNKLLTIFSILILTTVFSPLTLQKLAAETVPSFPSPTTVDIEKKTRVGLILLNQAQIMKS